MSIPCALLAVALALQADGSFVSTKGGFEVKLPGKPVEQLKRVPSDLGEIDMHLYVVDKGSSAYFAAYNDFPDIIADAPVENVLNGAANGAIQSSKGKLLVQKDIRLGAIPGKEVEFSVQMGPGKSGTARSWIYLDKTRLYQVMVLGDPAIVTGKIGTDFLNSFKITRTDKGPAAAKPSNPINFVSKAGKFEVKLPGQPTEQTKKLPDGGGGEIDLHLYIVSQGNTAYLAGYQDCRPAIMLENPKDVLDRSANGGVNAVKGTPTARKAIKLGNIPGTEVTFTAKLPGGIESTGRIRVYLDKQRLYQVGVMSDTDLATSAAGNAFLNSFKIKRGD